MSDEMRMTLLHHSTNDLIEELLMWRGLAAEHLDRIAELEAAQRWIPVSERLPELDQDVFAVVEGDFVIGHFYEEWEGNVYFSVNDGDAMMVATHWMPLPEPPEERER